MPLDLLDKALEPIRNNLESYTFSKLFKACRNALGMKKGKLAELAGININSVKHMENGFFSTPVKDSEIEGITKVFDLPFVEVKNKMIEHIELIEKRRKIKVHCEKHDEEEEMQFLRERKR